MTMADEYLIWSHEHGRWWGPGGRGYVRQLSQAGRFSRDNALTHCAHAIPGTAVRKQALPDLPVRLDDMLEIQQAYKTSFPLPLEPWE
jgi:hypothetical protein